MANPEMEESSIADRGGEGRLIPAVAILAANLGQGFSGAASAGDLAALDAFAAANGLSLPTSSVPEPGNAGMMVMAGLGILRRRRR
jgi:hypothetical protein